MGRKRSHKALNDEEGSEGTGSGSDRPTGCVQQVKKLVGMYTPNRKGAISNLSIAKTPGSAVSRRMGPPRNFPSTPKSNLRTGPLFTTVKMEQDPIQVYCRVKPLEVGDGCLQIRNDTEIALLPPDNPVYWRQNQAKEGHYTFSRIFHETMTQAEVFEEVALPMVADFIQGKNALLFAYGVTGSGKTYTMSGTARECGIMPRCLDVIFNSIDAYKATKFVFKSDRLNGFESQSKADAMRERQKEINEKIKESGRIGTPRTRARNHANDIDNFTHRRKDETSVPVTATDCFYSVFITHIEIYNNLVYDLLDETPIDTGKKVALQSKMLREGSNRNVYVNGVTEVEVESPEEAVEVFQRGLRRRRIAHTALNTESSRSHSIFNIRLVRAPSDSEGEEATDNKDNILISQLSLVDLAGSERYCRTQATGDRLKEAGNINNSLMNLRKCMDILRENQQNGTSRVVPFRDSKLTHFLKNYFEGEGRVRMILCVNPRQEDYDENFHVLSFAEQAQEVQITRPQEKKIVDLQTPGRNRANELYKESVRQLVAENVIGGFDLPKTDTGFVFLNLPIPICHITKSNEAEVLATLKKALEIRVQGQDELRKRINNEQEAFRSMLVSMERENETLKHENGRIKIKFQTLSEEKTKNETVLRQMMQEKNQLQVKYDEQDKVIQKMEEELADLRMQFRQRDVQHFKEKQSLKSDLELQRELDDLKRQRQVQREEKKMKAEFKEKEKTLAKVRQLVSSVDLTEATRRSSRSRHRALEESLSSTSSEPDMTAVARARSSGIRTRTPSAPPTGPNIELGYAQTRKALGIPNTHRPRARSTDQDIWIEHVTGLATKEGTVMQPCMKKKKSVTKLTNIEDISSIASKYCLRTAEQDSEGEIETRLYKGDVVGTVGGGAQVVFNDVEVLRQESPISPNKKRRSSALVQVGISSSSPFRNRSIHYDENAEDIADRCRQGVGSTMLSKRARPT